MFTPERCLNVETSAIQEDAGGSTRRSSSTLTSDSRRRSTIVEQRARRLSGRECDVANLLMTGKHSKAIAAELGISVRTVEVYRTRLLRKMQAESPSHLVTMLIVHQVKL
jgi:DNA-binding NarL/FixJ family response regulator